jgi:hypothetical protein
MMARRFRLFSVKNIASITEAKFSMQLFSCHLSFRLDAWITGPSFSAGSISNLRQTHILKKIQ